MHSVIDFDHDHSNCVRSALDRAVELCAESGARFTPIRRRVLELVWQRHAPVGAYEILEHLKQDGHNHAPPTVYRALDFLILQGLVHRVESANAYIGCNKPGVRHNGTFLICHACGTTLEVPDDILQETITNIAADNRFEVSQICTEIAGRCSDCRVPAARETGRVT